MLIDIQRQGIIKRKYEFKLRDELIGTLGYQRFFSKQAVMQWADQNWSACRKGVFRRKVVMQQTGGEALSFNFNVKMGKMVPVTYQDQQYFFRKNGILNTTYSWINSADRELMEFRKLRKRNPEIIVSLSFQDDPHMMWLAFLGWFFIICTKEDQAAAVAAAG